MKKSKFILLCTLLLVSCTNKLYVAGADFENKYISFITDHTSTREEIILKLGEPSWSFEEGRILTYRLSLDRKGNVIPVKISNYKNDPNFAYASPVATRYYSLVLIFSGKILEKHSLLLTNP
jgi:hypothetical protein